MFTEDLTFPAHQGLSVVFKSISLMVIICAGAIENAAIVYAIVKDRHLHRAPYYFVINLVISDLLRSVICLPFVQASVIHGSRWQYGSSACKLLAFASTFFIFGAVFALLVLALDRYVAILHHKLHARKLSGMVCLSVVLFGWAAAFILSFPPIFGLGSYKFNPLEDQCTFEHRYYTNNDSLVFVVVFLLAIMVTLSLYARILVYLRRHRRMKPVLLQPPRSETWNFVQPPPGVIVAGLPARTVPALRAGPGNGSAGFQIPTRQRLQGCYIPLQMVANQQPTAAPPNPTPSDNGSVLSRHEYRSAANGKLTRALFVATLVFDVIWLPYVISTCYFMFHADRVISQDFVTVATWFTYCQVAILPLVYILAHSPVGRHVLGASNVEYEAQGDVPYPLLSVDA